MVPEKQILQEKLEIFQLSFKIITQMLWILLMPLVASELMYQSFFVV